MLRNYGAYTLNIFYGKVNCTSGVFNLSVPVDSNILNTNELSTELNTSIFLQDKICIKQITKENSQPYVIKCNRTESIDDTEPALSLNDKRDNIILYGNVLSLPFLFLTIVTYTLIKELRTTFGMILIFYTVTMLARNIITTFRYSDRTNVILRKKILMNV